ncbi:MAG: hypothetical protein ACFCVD_00260 [Nodosilinea sp.]
MTSSAQQPESFEQQVLKRLDTLSGDVEQWRTESGRLANDVEVSNARFKKWDRRLWGLTLGLISTAWTAILAAAAVVITRILSGE